MGYSTGSTVPSEYCTLDCVDRPVGSADLYFQQLYTPNMSQPGLILHVPDTDDNDHC